jgi:hypothetical protein
MEPPSSVGELAKILLTQIGEEFGINWPMFTDQLRQHECIKKLSSFGHLLRQIARCAH